MNLEEQVRENRENIDRLRTQVELLKGNDIPNKARAELGAVLLCDLVRREKIANNKIVLVRIMREFTGLGLIACKQMIEKHL